MQIVQIKWRTTFQPVAVIGDLFCFFFFYQRMWVRPALGIVVLGKVKWATPTSHPTAPREHRMWAAYPLNKCWVHLRGIKIASHHGERVRRTSTRSPQEVNKSSKNCTTLAGEKNKIKTGLSGPSNVGFTRAYSKLQCCKPRELNVICRWISQGSLSSLVKESNKAYD